MINYKFFLQIVPHLVSCLDPLCLGNKILFELFFLAEIKMGYCPSCECDAKSSNVLRVDEIGGKGWLLEVV